MRAPISYFSKTPICKDQVKVDWVKPVKADKPLKEKKITGAHAHKDRVLPAKTALAF